MSLLTPAERAACEAFTVLTFGNPFLPERKEAEKEVLNGSGQRLSPGDGDRVWSHRAESDSGRPELVTLAMVAEQLAAAIAQRLHKNPTPGPAELDLAAAPGCYALFYRVQGDLLAAARAEEVGDRPEAGPNLRQTWRRFRDGFNELLAPAGRPIVPNPPAHLFALSFQVRRAFRRIFDGLYGSGLAAAELRAHVWDSVFTRDRHRYASVLFNRMHELPTLILGESGTGKEVVASALAHSRYRAFDERAATFEPPGAFEALSLSAMPSTLVESELFGHRRGSFTGAAADRPGRLEHVGQGGTVLLDEIGDVEPGVQVKLLRVLQERTFTRVGESKPRRFEGKVIAATHCDLPAMSRAGTFRADLYYRLAGDVIHTPPLRDLVAGDAEELRRLVQLVTRRLLPTDTGQADALAIETVDAIAGGIGLSYAWPGNFRELEQCVRAVLVRGEYTPPQEGCEALRDHADPAARLVTRLRAIDLSADDLVTAYCRHAYARLGTYEAAGRALGLDRRTVRSRLASTVENGAAAHATPDHAVS